MSKVSVIMPVYNGAKYIREAIDSVLAQTFQDWDFWIINEFGSNDGSAEIVSEYAQTDERFHLIQNQVRLGLAESLNTGFRLARGTYFARLDADDTAHPERFAKQVALMENHPEVGICGTWQHHFGPNEDWVHCPPASADKCRARLLFNCDLCHSTLMLRRETVLEHQLFYDNSFGAEDYELWCRAVWVTDIVNIPEVLGEYRVGDGNITADKEAMLDIESGQLVARNLEQSLSIHLTEDEVELFRGWNNPFDRFSSTVREVKLAELERILRQIYKRNTSRHIFDDTCLLEALARKWRWAKYHAPWDAQYEVKELSQIFDESYRPSFRLRYKEFCAHNTTLGSKIKKIVVVCLRPLARPFRARIEGLLNRLEKNTCDYVEDKTWDRYLRLSAELQQISIELQARQSALVELLEMRMQDMAQELIQSMDSRIWQAEQILTQSTDSRIWKAEQLLSQSMDSRIWQAEQTLTQSTDSRIWKAEQLLSQSMDSRIWQAEQTLTQSTDSRIWKAEQLLSQSMDSRIWQAEQMLTQSTDSRIWKAECSLANKITKADQADHILDETHRHIDFTYRDIMIALQRQGAFLPENKITLETDYPIAYESLDHLHPHGTVQDNTRYPRFVEKCERLLAPKKELAFLDLGCSGGGMVLDAALRGHISMGLEGSDYSKKEQRAEWRLLGDHLQTCDITRPFFLRDTNNNVQLFDVITAWEVLEHIAEADLPQLLRNIKNHLTLGGYFVGSIANWDDIDPESGVNWHITVHPYEWWALKFEEAGFRICTRDFSVIDLARGAYNPPQCYLKPANTVYTETSFHIAVKIGKR